VPGTTSCSPNCTTPALIVLLGNGDGTFQPATYIPQDVVGNVSIADLNGDGKPDIVMETECQNSSDCVYGTIRVLFGNGDGTFQPPVIYSPQFFHPSAIAIGDFNGDGVPDVAVTNTYFANSRNPQDSVAIFLANPDGTLQVPVNYTVGGYDSFSIAAGDFNRDGKLDLAVGNALYKSGSTGSFSVLLGNGDGTFQSPLTISPQTVDIASLAVGDFNGDGNSDIVFGSECAFSNAIQCSISPIVTLALGNGDGTFQRPANYSSNGGYSSLVPGDFNQDGKLDLAVLGNPVIDGSVTATLTIFLNKPAASVVLSSSANPSSYGQNVTFTAAVTSGSPELPTGSVTFKNGSATLGTSALSGGVATFSTTSLSVGTHSVTAVYGGDANYAGGASTPLSQVVGKAATITSLVSSLNPSSAGQAVTFTVTVASATTGTPSGAVAFRSGSKLIGSAHLSAGSASLSISTLAVGSDVISATYGGSPDYSGSSASLTQVVN